MTIEQAMQAAVQRQQAGRLGEAAQILSQTLARHPQHAAGYNLLGNLLVEGGQFDQAAEAHRRAVALRPHSAEFQSDLGNALRGQGRVAEAVAAFSRAIELKPDFSIAHYNLASVLRDQEKLAEAAAAYSAALRFWPELAEAHMGLSCVLRDQGKLGEAAVACGRAVQLKPQMADFHLQLGAIFAEQGKLDQAVAVFLQVIRLRPNDVAARMELGNALWRQGRYAEAAGEFTQVVQIAPHYAEAYSNLGAALWKQGLLDEALAACSRAIELKGDWAEGCSNLGNVLREQGRIAEALQCYDRALQLAPDDATMHSNRNFILQCMAGDDGEAVFQEHLRWGQIHTHGISPVMSIRDRSAGRKLRIGYISPDFREHPVARFLLPALENRDRVQFAVVCYSDAAAPDAMTKRIAASVDAWRNVVGVSDQRVADLIASDQIDILVDVAGHTAGNRLLVFARRPAPIQVTYLGYPNTTGLAAMDYRLTDSDADPPGMTERFHTERLIRLPACAWCFAPGADYPEPAEPPALRAGYVTFGCFNTLAKVSDQTLALWATAMRQEGLISSHLMLKARGLGSRASRQRIIEIMAGHGVAEDRLILMDWTVSSRQHLEAYQKIDIALDPFPYHGTTTTCESLWMGIPVVTLAGRTHICRVGVSLLTNAGLPELIAHDESAFAKITAALALDVPRLADLRATLRQRLGQSPLMDAARFAGDLESAYRHLAATIV